MLFLYEISMLICFAELAVGNIVRRVLHIIREEDLSLTTAAMAGLNLSAVSDDEDDAEHEDHPVLSAAAVAAAARSTLRAPSLQTLLEDIPDAAAVPHTSSSGGDSEGKSKCKLLLALSGTLLPLNFPSLISNVLNEYAVLQFVFSDLDFAGWFEY